MSEQIERSEASFREGRSPARTEKVNLTEMHQFSVTDRVDLHYDSPTKYDIDYYQRKVNRLDNDLMAVQEELSIARFKLTKAEDYEMKNQSLFKQNQDLAADLQKANEEVMARARDNDRLRLRLEEKELENKNLKSQLINQKQTCEDIRKDTRSAKEKMSKGGDQEKANVESNYQRKISQIKDEARDIQNKLRAEIDSLKSSIVSKENTEGALNIKLNKIREDKDRQIDRLKQLTNSLKAEIMNNSQDKNEQLIIYRTVLIEQTEDRILNVRSICKDIETCLMQEIRNLNKALQKKDIQIEFLLEADKKFMQSNEQIQNGLKNHIKRLQDQIFIIQRETEIELFNTIDRLRNQYEENINDLNGQFDRIRSTHNEQKEIMQKKIKDLQKETEILGRENKNIQNEHKKLARDKQSAMKMLSQKIIKLQSEKDVDLKNYTTSMKMIEDQAKDKLKDLHTAVQNKNTQSEILNAQMKLKNQQITFLVDQISKLRGQNRQKLRALQTTNAMEQNNLNDMITNYKKEIMELKRRCHELDNTIADREAQTEMKLALMRQDLNGQKEANQLLKARNVFLTNWAQELERDLKSERVSNVNILHDTNISKRQILQAREQVWVELEAIKNKEVQQIRNVFKLEKGRLESDLQQREHELREKKEELARLLAEYKKLESKIGKASKLDKGAEENGKCKATLQAEILLTENIFNAINVP